MACFLLGVGVLAVVRSAPSALSALHRAGPWLGFQLGFGVVTFGLGVLALNSAWFIRRHLGAAPTFWQAHQDYWRPRFLFGSACVGAACVAVAGAIALTHGAPFKAGAMLGFGAPPLAIALAALSGGIAPARFE